MENNVKYTAVGLFVVGLIGLTAYIILWLYGAKPSTQYETYLIETTTSVNGLDIGSAVKYKGVKVGKVKKISISEKNPEIVQILVDIDKNLPIKEDTYASIEIQGLTGLAYISLEGGSAKSKPLKKRKNQEYPLIRFKLSPLQQISNSLPYILNNTNELIKEIQKKLKILDINSFNKLAENSNNLINNANEFITNLNSKLDEISKTTQNINDLIEKGKITTENINDAVKDIKESSKALRELTININNYINKNKGNTEESIIKFKETLYKLNKTLENLDTLLEKIKDNPSTIIMEENTKPAPTERGEKK